MSLDDILREISADNAWESVLHITSDIPSRLAGSANARMMAEFADEKLRQAGLNSQLHEFPGLVAFPEPATVWALAPQEFTIDAFTLAQSASTESLEGELIDLGAATEADYIGRDVRGKITLSEFPYAPARHEKALVAWKHGAAAQIFMNFGDDDCDAYAFGSVKSPWGNPTPDALEHDMPDLVCVSISRVDGLRLKRLCERGPVRVRLNAKTANGWHNLTMTCAEFGTEPEHEFMLLGGHMDSWYGPQATDNATGDACILELARVFKQHEGELRRGLITALWMGHETGTMISSTRFADVNWDRLRKSCVAYLQVDQPAIGNSAVWHTASTEDIQSYSTRVARETLGNFPQRWGRQSKNGDSSFFGVGIAALAGEMMFSEEEARRTGFANLGWFHHSAHNTLDKVDRGLPRAAPRGLRTLDVGAADRADPAARIRAARSRLRRPPDRTEHTTTSPISTCSTPSSKRAPSTPWRHNSISSPPPGARASKPEQPTAIASPTGSTRPSCASRASSSRSHPPSSAPMARIATATPGSRA